MYRITSAQNPISPHSAFLSALLLALFAFCFANPAQAQTPTTTVIPQSYFGMSANHPTTVTIPASPFTWGLVRVWDSGLQWPQINTASGTFDYTGSGFDTYMAKANTANNNMVGFYTLSRTPSWASSAPSDTDCNYGNGQCDAPTNLAVTGTGENTAWDAWVHSIAEHVNTTSYLANHVPIKYWEIWNEIDRQNPANYPGNVSWKGTYAQLVRMAEDARCIITGQSGKIHNYPAAGDSSETCAQYLTHKGWTAPDPSSQIVAPSGHDFAASHNFIKNFLYCNGGASTGSPDYCNLGGAGDARAGADAVDIINFHLKPANPSPPPVTPDPEESMIEQYASVEGILQSLDQPPNKFLWNGESGYAGNGWSPASGGGVSLSGNVPGQVAFVGRFYLMQWSVGIQNSSWYQWDNSNTLGGTDGATAYEQVYNWMLGTKMTTGCAEVGTQWTCTLKDGTYTAIAIWDTSFTCSSSGCTTQASYTAPGNMNYYRTLANSTEHAIPGSNILTHVIGLQPILLESEPASNR